MNNKRKKSFYFLVWFFVSSIFILLLAITLSLYILHSPVSNKESESILFSVPRGSSVRSIVDSLADNKLIRSARFAQLYVRFSKDSLKAGTYRIYPSMSLKEILSIISSGKQESLRITIPEGLSLLKTAKHIADSGLISEEDFILAASDPQILSFFGIKGDTAEGYLFPDTYFFSFGDTAPIIVEMMIKNFFYRIATIPSLNENSIDLFQTVILASIIEREYRLVEEAPLIASVFSNRLKIGMGLQSCATVEYIITEIQKKPHPTRLLVSDLEIPSDYNTYLWAGLPPGPICSPGLVALSAAFNHPKTGYLYFRLTDPEVGSHAFTRSLDEHVKAGRNLVLKKAAGK